MDLVRKRFGKNVDDIILGMHFHTNSIIDNFLTNELMLDLSMFGPSVTHQICCKFDDALIVTSNNS